MYIAECGGYIDTGTVQHKLHWNNNRLFKAWYFSNNVVVSGLDISSLSILALRLALLFIMHLSSFAIALATISTALLRTVSAVEVTYTNKHYYYFDIDGNAIDSTNGKVQWVKDQYFWISEPDCKC